VLSALRDHDCDRDADRRQQRERGDDPRDRDGRGRGVRGGHRPDEGGEDGHRRARESDVLIGARRRPHAGWCQRSRRSGHLVGQQGGRNSDDVVGRPRVVPDEGTPNRDDCQEDQDDEEDVAQHHLAVARCRRSRSSRAMAGV